LSHNQPLQFDCFQYWYEDWRDTLGPRFYWIWKNLNYHFDQKTRKNSLTLSHCPLPRQQYHDNWNHLDNWDASQS
jgi:hypothetical protein